MRSLGQYQGLAGLEANSDHAGCRQLLDGRRAEDRIVVHRGQVEGQLLIEHHEGGTAAAERRHADRGIRSNLQHLVRGLRGIGDRTGRRSGLRSRWRGRRAIGTARGSAGREEIGGDFSPIRTSAGFSAEAGGAICVGDIPVGAGSTCGATVLGAGFAEGAEVASGGREVAAGFATDATAAATSICCAAVVGPGFAGTMDGAATLGGAETAGDTIGAAGLATGAPGTAALADPDRGAGTDACTGADGMLAATAGSSTSITRRSPSRQARATVPSTTTSSACPALPVRPRTL
jgi:hypothetical protein